MADESLPALATAACRRAAQLAQPIFLCFSEIIPPVEPLAWLRAQPQERLAYWQQPDFSLAGSGASALWQDGGGERFQRALAFCESVVSRSAGEVPLMVGGFAFAEQSHHNCLWLPQRLLVQSAGQSRLQIQYAVLPGMEGAAVVMAVLEQVAIAQKQSPLAHSSDSEDPELLAIHVDNPQQKTWRETIHRALTTIREGTLKKVVLARTLEVRAQSPWQLWRILSRLQKQFPDCFNFLLESPDGRLFLGASPERLFQIEAGRLTCDAIAGSIERGENPTQDQSLADSLWHSAKDRHEHALVVQSICDRLRQCGLVPHPSDHPQLLKLVNVQHLHTPIRVQLLQTSLNQIFTLLQSLHPTAAVGGEPRQQALDFLTAWEPRDRGWYAAPVGWLDGTGRGTFAVGIRSAYLAGDRAELFAGAGIVAASRLEDETAETLLKFAAMLDALGVSRIP